MASSTKSTSRGLDADCTRLPADLPTQSLGAGGSLCLCVPAQRQVGAGRERTRTWPQYLLACFLFLIKSEKLEESENRFEAVLIVVRTGFKQRLSQRVFQRIRLIRPFRGGHPQTLSTERDLSKPVASPGIYW